MSYKTIEEIREDNELSQVDFAQALGMSRRTYLNRLSGDAPDYLVKEVVEASKYNKGKVKVKVGSEEYEIEVRKV